MKQSQAKQPAKIPARFEPKSWANADQRQLVIREIKRRHAELARDAGVESYQQRLLAERAIFISLQLETAEVEATEGKGFNAGVYTQMTNTLIGLLKALGLERKDSTKPWLQASASNKAGAKS